MTDVLAEIDLQIYETNEETDLQIYEYAETDLQIYSAALSNNWDDVCGLFRERPELKTKPVNERLETPLMIAVGTNSSHQFVKELLNNVTPLDHDSYKWCGVNNSGDNVLHYAAHVGNMEDARLLAGCLPLWMMSSVGNSSGDTPVLLAAKRGRKDMIDEVFLTYVFAETDLQIYRAALNNNWDDVCGLFVATPVLMTKPVNERLETPLMIAVGTNSSHQFVWQLLNNVSLDKWCGVNNSGDNALHYAAHVGNMEDARLLAGYLPMSSVKNSSGYTPLLLAAELGRKDMIDEVFNKTYVFAETDLQIYRAALNNNWDDVCGLFRERPELMTKTVNELLETPLMIAVGTNSSHEFVKQMLNDVAPLDRDINKWCGVNKRGNNVLHYAAQVGNMEDARLMARCLPLWMMSSVRNSSGDTPVLLAAKRGRKDMIDEVFLTYVFAETDLQIYRAALNNNWDDVCGLFRDRPELMTKTVNERLETPLMIAVGTNSSHEFVKTLLYNLMPLDNDIYKFFGVNKSGNNVVHYAAKVGNMKDTKLMAGCLPIKMMTSVKNSSGYTPLLLAAKLGRKDMIDEFFFKQTAIRHIETGGLIIPAIQTGLLDLALWILHNYIGPDEIPPNALEALATKPEFFPSGNRLGFWCGLIYQWMPIIGIEILEQVTAKEFFEV